jgi:hypothetical protein
MKFIRIIALQIRKYFKNTDVYIKKNYRTSLYCHLFPKKIYLINIYV